MVLRQQPARLAVAVAVAVAILAVIPTVSRWPGLASQPAALGGALASTQPASGGRLGQQALIPAGPGPAGGRAAGHAAARPRRPEPRARGGGAAHYRNPLRDISGLIAERIDMGVDFGGTGPIYALGDAVVTNAVAGTADWPGGGWITYRLISGQAAGLMVFVAEDVTPAVSVGQHVTSSTVIAHMFNGGAGIETGWAQPGAWYTESQSPLAGGISGGGPFPTQIGLEFEKLIEALGVPAANNRGQTAYGLLPPGYPAFWHRS